MSDGGVEKKKAELLAEFASVPEAIGLYLNLPQHAAVFCLDEKTAHSGARADRIAAFSVVTPHIYGLAVRLNHGSRPPLPSNAKVNTRRTGPIGRDEHASLDDFVQERFRNEQIPTKARHVAHHDEAHSALSG